MSVCMLKEDQVERQHSCVSLVDHLTKDLDAVVIADILFLK